MHFTAAVWGHIAVGSLALVLYWVALLSRKGSLLHRKAGKRSLALLIVVALSVGPLLFLRAGPFDPGYVVQMVYLTVCVATVSTLAVASIRTKARPDAFRGRLFRVMGPVLLGLGLLVLVAGVVRHDPVAAVLSWVGLAYGSSMIMFARQRGPIHPKWWLGWHLNAVCGLFNAVHGTFLHVVSVWAFGLNATPGTQAWFQLGTLLAAVALRIGFGQRYGVPLLSWARPARQMAPV